MSDGLPVGQPNSLGNGNGCLTQVVNFVGGVAIITAVGVYVPTSSTKQTPKPEQKIESVKQDSTSVPKDSTLVMTPNGKVFDYNTKQMILDTYNLAKVR